MEEENKLPRKKWDLIIGIALVLLGSFRLYERLQVSSEWDYRIILTIVFIPYGGFLIYRFFKSQKITKD